MKRVLLAYSNTGGGHRAAALAIAEGLRVIHSDVDIRMVDPYERTEHWPFNRLSAAYPRVVDRASWLWRSGFALTNTTQCTATLQALAWPALRSTFVEIEREFSPDVVVSTHSLLATPLRRVFPRTPIAVVVTDLVSGHKSWYQRSADLLIAPTNESRDRALACGVPAARAEVIGLPVSLVFTTPAHSPKELRIALGWSRVRPTVLIAGGGDGVGPLEQIVTAIDAARLPIDVAVVTGRNALLADRLRSRMWHGTVHVYGFVSNFADLLRASAALVTKAGPGTICEACAAGCPLVLFGAIPGQETGNVEYVCSHGAGHWAPSPQRVVEALQTWFGGNAHSNAEGDVASHARSQAAEAALSLARPRAALHIAARVLQLAECGRTPPRARRRYWRPTGLAVSH